MGLDKELQTEKVMKEKTEIELINMLIDQVRKNDMTILNLRQVTAKAINYLESNAVLEKEDSDITKPSNQD
ncbi:hypothetical protein [Tissierella creatinophila]|uniref:Uncharacterized protein n=1 Tax=Tissierella creatinophila DSM 6911 TaxID=1123403 RepID=A0A1U7M6K6_TISCR|nr:hypothetical protein [Tissierella creatinophila]OLS02916.1 hypothetical protein TICRE_10700 [Tissierella creatinophila DSM 6911]